MQEIENRSEKQLETLRDAFEIPANTCYLDGNSLGALSHTVRHRITEFIDAEWGADLVAGWNKHQWLVAPIRVGDKIGRLIGAEKGQVVCCDNLSVNLFKLLSAALALNSPRTKILTDINHFPSDNYIAQGLAQLIGPKRCQICPVNIDALMHIDLSDVAVLSLPHVDYKTGTRHRMTEITHRAHSQGALVLWDLAHSAGAIECSLDLIGVDMAVGCTYKYLNGGPGAPGYLYLAGRHHQAENVISGWMGHEAEFSLHTRYTPAPGIKRFLTGTQSIISLIATEAALDLFDGLTPAKLEARSTYLTGYFLDQLSKHSATRSILCLTPASPKNRGAQISLRFDQAYPISRALIAQGVIVDFREPDIVRFGFSPIYNNVSDADRAISALVDLLISQNFKDPQFSIRKKVT